ncbi:hypothetical protein [Rothia sp. ZJ932]|uniref:hypothetical protein n=1 Tax=Rothia sp. ZJ932 TaxID=2810516 RepID=UPI00196886D9|nr:hypothetical protein [Rothia sp. ZJ932]QRZ62173.1 hypothetical protein JR346_03395 [Rothia sp. ZJ932]
MGSPVATENIATQLKKPASGTSILRSSLIEKGLIYSPAYGKIAFTVPGMKDYLSRAGL